MSSESSEKPPEFVQTPGGLSLRYRDSWLYSARDPRALPQRSALSFALPQRSLVLVLSPLLGYGLDILLERLPPDCGILCVEADRGLFDFSHELIAPAIRSDPRFRYIHARKPRDLIGSVADIATFRRVLVLSLSGGASLNISIYEELRAALAAEISTLWRNKATLNRMGRLWLRNVIANIGELGRAQSLRELNRKREGRPIIVAGAGPSLEGLLRFLSGRSEAFFILAVDTALPAFLAMGIRPDAVICLEGQCYNLKDFIGASASGIDIIPDLSAHPFSFRGLGGGVYPIASHFADCRLLERLTQAGLSPPGLPPLGSVGVAALHLGIRLSGSDSPLFFSGLDFSYPRGKVHARGSPSHAALLAGMSRLKADSWYVASLRPGTMSVSGLGGRPRISDPILSSYAQLARAEIARAPQAVYDLRGEGLELGAINLSLEALADFLPQKSKDSPGPAVAAVGGPVARTPDDAASGSVNGAASGSLEWPPEVGPRESSRAQAVQAFARAELERVEELRAILAGSPGAQAWRLEALLAECDYLYLHFPDYQARDSLSQSVLKRVSVEADSAIERWRRIC